MEQNEKVAENFGAILESYEYRLQSNVIPYHHTHTNRTASRHDKHWTEQRARYLFKPQK